MRRIQNSSDLIRKKIKEQIDRNWGFPFIASFIVLLLTAAILLASGYSSFAEEIAIYAYFALAAGAVLQLVNFRRNNTKSGEID